VLTKYHGLNKPVLQLIYTIATAFKIEQVETLSSGTKRNILLKAVSQFLHVLSQLFTWQRLWRLRVEGVANTNDVSTTRKGDRE